MAQYFDRYESFKSNGEVKPLHGITIDPVPTDKTVLYKQGQTRLDKLSNDYYGNPFHGFLIMAANQQYGGLEFNIPDREIIRIPFPFESAIERYIAKVNKHKQYYG